jgi:hypothetical protein
VAAQRHPNPAVDRVVVRLDWQPILERAAEIVDSYETPVTLRQLFYRLVGDRSGCRAVSDVGGALSA